MRGRTGLQVMLGLLTLALVVGVGAYTYNLGVARGIAEAGRAIAAPGPGGPVVAYWPRPWGFGFGFFPFFPLLFILFWFFVARALFWRGAWGRCGWGRGGWGYGGGYGGVPPAFDEWHRRAHAQPPSPTADPKQAV